LQHADAVGLLYRLSGAAVQPVVAELHAAGTALPEPELAEPCALVGLAEDAEHLAEDVAVVIDAERDARVGTDIGDRHGRIGTGTRRVGAARRRDLRGKGGRQRESDRDRQQLATSHDTPPESMRQSLRDRSGAVRPLDPRTPATKYRRYSGRGQTTRAGPGRIMAGPFFRNPTCRSLPKRAPASRRCSPTTPWSCS